MNKFVAIIFPDESQAYKGTLAFKELHAEGSLTLYGLAVVAKDSEGNFEIRDTADAGPLGAAVGALTGGLIGAISGPAGSLVGAAGGSLFGSLMDLFNYGVGADFIWQVSKQMLDPGKTAVVAEIAEDWTIPLDVRMEALGGLVLRTWRADFEDEQLAREAAAERAELEQLQAEHMRASAETKAKLKAKLEQAKAMLAQLEKRLETRLKDLEKEANAKVAALERQIVDAKEDAKEFIQRRIAALRTDYKARSANLKQAWQLTKEAFAI
jgi:uncharacterized membrane protein